MNLKDKERVNLVEDHLTAFQSYFILFMIMVQSRKRNGLKINEFRFLILFYLKCIDRNSPFNAYGKDENGEYEYFDPDICNLRIYDIVLRSLKKKEYISTYQKGWYKINQSGLVLCQSFWRSYTLAINRVKC